MAQVELRIESVQFGCAQQRIDRSRAFSTSIRTGEEIVLAAQGHRARSAAELSISIDP